jgi:hypothetical protein
MPTTRTTAAERSAEELKIAQQRKDAVETEDVPATKTRNLMSDRCGLFTSDARVRNHIKYVLTPYEVGLQLQELMVKRREAQEAGNTAVVDDCKAKIAELNKQVVRIGGDAPIAIAAAVDRIIKDITINSFNLALEKKRKTAEVAYIHNEGNEGLSTYPLFRDLPEIRNYDPEEEADLRIKQAALNKEHKEQSMVRKSEREAVVAAAVAAGVEPPPVHKPTRVTAAPSEPSSTPTTTFNTYVEAAINSIRKNDPDYGHMRLAARYRGVMVELVAQFVCRIGELARIQVLETANARTLTSRHVKTVIRIMFTNLYGSEDNAELEELMVFISEKVALYHEISQASKDTKETKKADALAKMTTQERLELEKKSAAAAETKRVNALAAAKKRAEAAASAIALLTTSK